MNAEDSNLLLKEMAEQLLIAGGLADLTDILAQIEAVTINDVNTVSSSLIYLFFVSQKQELFILTFLVAKTLCFLCFFKSFPKIILYTLT